MGRLCFRAGQGRQSASAALAGYCDRLALGMIAPERSRAARAWLDWNQDDLAKCAQVALSTVRDFDKGRRVPIKNNPDAYASHLR